MNTSEAASTTIKLRSAPLWRIFHSIFPVGQRLNPLLLKFFGTHAFIKLPWQGYWLTISGTWLNNASSASAPIYQPPQRQNPEFFEIIEPLLATLRTGCIVDVGANIGIYTLNLRRCSRAPIIAFEPDPSLFSLLSENVYANDLSSVILKNVACGNIGGRLLFKTGINGNVVGDALNARESHGEKEAVPGSGALQSDAIISVPVVRLDDELRDVEAVSLIKIDCEGYEWNVLSGCLEIIRTRRPIVFVELHPKLIGNFDRTVSDVCDLLRPFYHLKFWDAGRLQRSASRFVRFFGHYRKAMAPLRDEAEMLAVSKLNSQPDQIYMLGLPRDGGTMAAKT